MFFVGLDLIWPSSDGQNERDRWGRREVGQRCVPAGEVPDRSAAKPVPQHRLLTVLSHSIMPGSRTLSKWLRPAAVVAFLVDAIV